RLRPQAVHNLPRAPDLISTETSPKTVGQEGGPMTRFATTLVAFTLIALTAMQPVAAQDNTLGGALLGGAAGAIIGGAATGRAGGAGGGGGIRAGGGGGRRPHVWARPGGGCCVQKKRCGHLRCEG